MAVDGVDGAQTEGLDGLDTGEVHFRKSGLGGNQPAPSGRRRLLPRALSIILPLIPARREGRGSKHGNKHCDRRPSNAHGVTVPQANGIAENATASVPDCEAISAAIPCLMCTRTDRRSLFVTPNPMKITMPDVSGSLVTTRSEEHTSELQSLMRSSYAV